MIYSHSFPGNIGTPGMIKLETSPIIFRNLTSTPEKNCNIFNSTIQKVELL